MFMTCVRVLGLREAGLMKQCLLLPPPLAYTGVKSGIWSEIWRAMLRRRKWCSLGDLSSSVTADQAQAPGQTQSTGPEQS